MTTVNPNYVPLAFLDTTGAIRPDMAERAAEVSRLVSETLATLPPAEQHEFLSLVRSGALDLTPAGAATTVDLKAAIQRLALVGAVLVQFDKSTGSMIDYLARVLVEQSAQQREQALNDRIVARQAAQKELLAQAGQMQKSADELEKGAGAALATSLTMSILSAGLSGLSMIKGITSMKSLKTLKNDLDTNPATTDKDLGLESIKQKDARNGGIGGMGQTANQLGMSGSNYASTDSQAASKEAEAQGSVDAAQAQELEMIADIKKEMEQGFSELIQSIISFLRDLGESEADLARAFTRV